MSDSYDRDNPFLAAVKERSHLCAPESGKQTLHIVLDLAGSGMTYAVGDSIAVQPYNHDELVAKTLEALRMHGDEEVCDLRRQETLPLQEMLKKRVNLSDVNRKLLKVIADRQSDENKKQQLHYLFESENRDQLKRYLAERELWDVLLENGEVQFSSQELVEMTTPLLPRFYSIASSLSHFDDEVHLTVARVIYESGGHPRLGICTNYLCDHVPLHQPVVPVYIQPHKGFTIPEDGNADMIMIGPGTGVAPFRAFMQERLATGAAGRNWLFFGEWTRKDHFLYGDYWTDLQKEGKLKLDLAFSRDQPEKVYVQHRMLENSEELYRWIQGGAYVYVCGDANYMAKDVESALVNIFEQHGHDGMATVKQLRKEKRYLRDVY
ncbi:MAG: sulfite reductase [Chlamydiales bacterium]|nr:sulfite reductase [Chlamydiia bacterium]MCP5507758.1 sulfite reductase [Chlamydiales bacterium]